MKQEGCSQSSMVLCRGPRHTQHTNEMASTHEAGSQGHSREPTPRSEVSSQPAAGMPSAAHSDAARPLAHLPDQKQQIVEGCLQKTKQWDDKGRLG